MQTWGEAALAGVSTNGRALAPKAPHAVSGRCKGIAIQPTLLYTPASIAFSSVVFPWKPPPQMSVTPRLRHGMEGVCV